MQHGGGGLEGGGDVVEDVGKGNEACAACIRAGGAGQAAWAGRARMVKASEGGGLVEDDGGGGGGFEGGAPAGKAGQVALAGRARRAGRAGRARAHGMQHPSPSRQGRAGRASSGGLVLFGWRIGSRVGFSSSCRY